ncbi:MAG: peptidase [Chlorobi bacterium]|nr:peptidase [Chlorobiota bacterium]
MKLKIAIVFILSPLFIYSQPEFDKYFKNNSLRFDFLLAGNAKSTLVYPQQLKKEPYWGGSKANLISPFNYGSYRYKVFDLDSDSLIFLKGFSTLFKEWQTTAEAKETNRAFYHAVVFPFPKKGIRLEIDARQWEGNFKTIYTTEIDPADYHINSEVLPDINIDKILDNGKPEKKVDMVILAEGYTQQEKGDFIEDVKRLIDRFFTEPPYDEEKNNFNVYAVFAPSLESGTDMPREKIYKNTCFNSTFNTFDLPRYLTSSDIKTIYDAAAVVPYDQIYLLVNTTRYGGGAFYNYLNVCSSDNELSENIFLHEFGHGFAGLGDEYYSSEVAYEDFYNPDIEPWEPNLTTLVDFGHKWKDMVIDSIPIPTPRKSKFSKGVGVFEGGGYMNKGMYSPMMDCRMKSNQAKYFCPACQKAIRDVIDFYTK